MYEILNFRYEKVKMLGEGSFGQVNLYKDAKSNDEKYQNNSLILSFLKIFYTFSVK